MLVAMDRLKVESKYAETYPLETGANSLHSVFFFHFLSHVISDTLTVT